MTNSYSNGRLWDQSTSTTMLMLQNATNEEIRRKYLTKTPYTNYTKEWEDLLNSRVPGDPSKSVYLYIAALGGRGDGATKYIENYIVKNILPITVPNKEYVNIASVCNDINAILCDNVDTLKDIIDNHKSEATPFIREVCDEYFGYVFGTRLKVMKTNLNKYTNGF